MRKLILISLILFISTSSLYSQKEYYNWVFGESSGISFNTDDLSPVNIDNNKYFIKENSSVISDSQGNLLLYSFSDSLADAEGNIIDSGEIFDGHQSSTQGSILIKLDENNFMRIGSSSVIENADNSKEHNLSYVKINKFDNNYVIGMKNTIRDGYFGENLEVIEDVNSNSFYLTINDRKLAKYYLYKYNLDEDRFVILDSLNSKLNYENEYSVTGYLKSSPNGRVIISNNYGNKTLEIINFDKKSEKLIFKKVIQLEKFVGDLELAGYSGEFSPNSNYYYFFISNYMYALIFDQNEYQEAKLINSNIVKDGAGAMLLGPDEKIYVVNALNKQYLTVINNPNNIKKPYIDFLGFKLNYPTVFGLPNIPTSFYINEIQTEDSISVCEGEEVRLNVVINQSLNDTVYNWTGPNGFNSNEKSPKIKSVEKYHEGTYNIEVVNNDQKYYSKTYLKVFDKPNAKIIAKPDSIVCEGNKVRLELNNGYEKYQWSNGRKSSYIDVNESGKYSVIVENKNGCLDTTEVNVKIIKTDDITIDGPDKICAGDEFTLTVKGDYLSYNWSTGDTTKSITADKSGNYEVTIVTKDNCIISTSKEVSYYQTVSAEIESDATSVCKGDTVRLESKYHSSSFKYLWSTGETTRSIEVTETDTYKLFVTDTLTGCKDSSNIAINVEEELNVEIIGNEAFCEGGSAILKVEPTNDNYSYKWSTGETEPQIEVTEPGTYTVEVSTERCSGTAEFTVEQFPLPEFTIEGDRIICEGETTTLTASKEFEQYEWSTGDTTRSITVGEGDYTLTVTDENGCTSTESFSVEEKILELAFESMKYDFGKVYISESRDTTIEITNNSGEEVTAIIGGDQVNIPEDGYTHQYNLDNSSMGAKQDFITIQVTEPCEAEYQIEITAEVYARVTLSTINIHTEIGATETVPYYLEAEADLGQQEFNITTDIERDLFFTNDSYQIPSPQAINQQRTQVHEQTGTILLAELYEYPITFPQVEFDNPYIEKDTIPGKITFDEICIHDLRLIHTYAPTEVSIAPNPARDVINIDISTGEEGNFTIELISTEGRTTYTDSWNQSSSSKNIQIDTRDISTGVYQIRLTTEGHIYKKEVVVVE